METLEDNEEEESSSDEGENEEDNEDEQGSGSDDIEVRLSINDLLRIRKRRNIKETEQTDTKRRLSCNKN